MGLNSVRLDIREALVSLLIQKRTIWNALFLHRHLDILHTKTSSIEMNPLALLWSVNHKLDAYIHGRAVVLSKMWTRLGWWDSWGEGRVCSESYNTSAYLYYVFCRFILAFTVDWFLSYATNVRLKGRRYVIYFFSSRDYQYTYLSQQKIQHK